MIGFDVETESEMNQIIFNLKKAGYVPNEKEYVARAGRWVLFLNCPKEKESAAVAAAWPNIMREDGNETRF